MFNLERHVENISVTTNVAPGPKLAMSESERSVNIES